MSIDERGNSQLGTPQWLDEWLKIHSSPAGREYVHWYLKHNDYEEILATSDRSGHSVMVDYTVIWGEDYIAVNGVAIEEGR